MVATVEKGMDDACAAGAAEDIRIAGQMGTAAIKQAHYDAIAKIEKARLDAIAQKQVRLLLLVPALPTPFSWRCGRVSFARRLRGVVTCMRCVRRTTLGCPASSRSSQRQRKRQLALKALSK